MKTNNFTTHHFDGGFMLTLTEEGKQIVETSFCNTECMDRLTKDSPFLVENYSDEVFLRRKEKAYYASPETLNLLYTNAQIKFYEV